MASDRLAVGSLASTYLAWRAQSEEVVVVRRVHDHLLGDETLTRMISGEARHAATLTHPNVVSLLEVVDQPDELAVTTSFVSGATLSEILEASYYRPLPPPIAVAVAVAMLRGLHEAHEHAVIHRGLSWNNVFIGEDGHSRIKGFGVAKASLCRPGALPTAVRRALPYASPEELTERQVDARSDLYAASVILWEALTGRPLFAGRTIEATVQNILAAPVAAPSHFGNGNAVSRTLDCLVLRGLDREAGCRFATAQEMALALETEVGGASTTVVRDFVRSFSLPAFAARGSLAKTIALRERGR